MKEFLLLYILFIAILPAPLHATEVTKSSGQAMSAQDAIQSIIELKPDVARSWTSV